MRDNIQAKTQKDFFNLKSIKYKRISNAVGSLITFNNSKDRGHNNGLIEFPVIESAIEKQKKNSTVLILERKIIEQQFAKKASQKQPRIYTKRSQQNRRKKIDHSMNMLGLDVMRIKCLSQQYRQDFQRQEKMKKIFKISQKNSEIRDNKSTNQYSQELVVTSTTQRKNTQTIQLINEIQKLQITESFIVTGKRSNSNITAANKIRKMSIPHANSTLYNESFIKALNNQSINFSPSKTPSSPERNKNPRKKQYLYKKLQGTQNKKKQQFGQVYQRRIRSYLDFLFKVQIAHNFISIVDLKFQDVNSRPKKLKAYIGPGNNGAMIKGLIKRRFWWTLVDEKTQDCHFVWTQIKINQIFSKQLKIASQRSQHKPLSYSLQNSTKKSPSKAKKLQQVKNKEQKFFQNNELYNSKLLNCQDQCIYQGAYEKISQRQRQISYQQKIPYIDAQKKLYQKLPQIPHLIHNHLQNNFYLGNKKALFHNLKEYYHLIKENPFDYLPFTFHIKNGFKDHQYLRFCQYHKRRNKIIKKQEKQQEEGYGKRKTRNIWIVKPGQNSNQGRGITVIDEVYELNMIMKQKTSKSSQKSKPQSSSTNASTTSASKDNKQANSTVQQQQEKSTFIVQAYIDRPFLYNNRKFDIRHYLLITNFFGITRAYWYEEGYIRTSSYQFNVHCFQPEIHLTNDAVQKHFPDYHKYQPYNKLSYEEFQRYLDLNFSGKNLNFKEMILPKMKKMGTDAAKSVFTKICPENPMNNFEIFGLDFMIDKDFRPWLIQINTNPCLQCQCPLLDRIIPYMVQQSFKLSIDVAYPPPYHYPSTYRHFAPLINLQNFKYQLIFDSQVQGDELIALYKKVKGNLIEQIGQIQEDETFKNDGKEIKLDDFT